MRILNMKTSQPGEDEQKQVFLQGRAWGKNVGILEML